MVQIQIISMARREIIAGRRGEGFDDFLCLSVTFLNGKVCANDIDLKPFEFRNGC